MSTRCVIATEYRTLKSQCRYEAICCYNGGHDFGGGAGAVLKRHYLQPEKINALMAMGDLLRLEPNRVHPRRPSTHPSHPSNARLFRSHDDLVAFALRLGVDFIYQFDGRHWQTLAMGKNYPDRQTRPPFRPR